MLDIERSFRGAAFVPTGAPTKSASSTNFFGIAREGSGYEES
jgi:hypothetical protein